MTYRRLAALDDHKPTDNSLPPRGSLFLSLSPSLLDLALTSLFLSLSLLDLALSSSLSLS